MTALKVSLFFKLFPLNSVECGMSNAFYFFDLTLLSCLEDESFLICCDLVCCDALGESFCAYCIEELIITKPFLKEGVYQCMRLPPHWYLGSSALPSHMLHLDTDFHFCLRPQVADREVILVFILLYSSILECSSYLYKALLCRLTSAH